MEVIKKQEGIWTTEVSLFLLTIILSCLVQSSSIIDPLVVPRFITLNFGLLVLGLLWVFKQSKSHINWDLVSLSAASLCFLFYISILWTKVPGEGFFHAGRVLAGVTFFLFSTRIFKNHPEIFLSVSKLMAVLILIYSATGLIQLFQIKQINGISIYEVCSLSAHRNLFSSFLFLSIPFMFYGIFTADKWKSIYIFCICIALFFIIILQTRAVWVGSVVTVLVSGTLYFLKHGFKIAFLKNRKIWIYTSLVFVIIIIVSITLIKLNFLDTFLSNFNLGDNSRYGSVIARFQQWNNTWQLVKDYPLTGVGSGNWQFLFPKYNLVGNQEALDGVTFQRPHNDFLWILSETGFLGLLAYLLMFIVPIYKTIKRFWLEKSESNNSIDFLLACFLIGFLCISFFDFPRERIELIVLSHLLLAYLYSKSQLIASEKSQLGNRVFLMIVPLLFLNVAIGYCRFRGERFTVKLYQSKANKDWIGTLKYAEAAKSAFYTTDPSSMPLSWYKGVAYSNLKEYEKSFDEFKDAYSKAPYNYFVLNNMGTCYLRNSQNTLAKSFFMEALRINPTYDESKINMALIYYDEKDYQEALKYLSFAKPSPRRDRYKSIIEPLAFHSVQKSEQ